jgi:ubiquinone/menaquinone biosynthesis C-methylase UbiE
MKPSSHLSYKYQYNFSDSGSAMYDQTGRRRKAITMVAVLEDYLKNPLKDLTLLNIGGSTGIIDQYLAQHLGSVISVDIDQKAIHYASENYTSKNLQFVIGDAMQLSFTDNSFDLAICSQVYEHVPNADQMMAEIYRVLKPGGVCYFAAGNKIMLIEPHYNLPFLSLLPKPLADLYIKASGKGNYYYEKHLTIWGLKN